MQCNACRLAGLLVMALLISVTMALPLQASETAVLAPGDGASDVEAYCGTCHSLRLVVQQRLSYARWDEVFRYMVEEQGMAPLEVETRRLMLDYLTEHYGYEAADAGE